MNIPEEFLSRKTPHSVIVGGEQTYTASQAIEAMIEYAEYLSKPPAAGSFINQWQEVTIIPFKKEVDCGVEYRIVDGKIEVLKVFNSLDDEITDYLTEELIQHLEERIKLILNGDDK